MRATGPRHPQGLETDSMKAAGIRLDGKGDAFLPRSVSGPRCSPPPWAQACLDATGLQDYVKEQRLRVTLQQRAAHTAQPSQVTWTSCGRGASGPAAAMDSFKRSDSLRRTLWRAFLGREASLDSGRGGVGAPVLCTPASWLPTCQDRWPSTQQAIPRNLLVLDTRKINMVKAWSLPSSIIWGKREVNPHAGCTGRDPGPPSSPWTPPAEEKSVSFLLQHPLEPLHPRSQHRPGTA